MFATLDLKAASSTGPEAGVACATTQPPARPKRSQVRRACDWCKLMRIRCENERPCYNCRQARRECGTSRQNQFRSLAAAVKEVETLRAQLRQLGNLPNQSEAPKNDAPASTSPAMAVSSPGPPSPSPEQTMTEQQQPSITNSRTTPGFTHRPVSNLRGTTSLSFLLDRMQQYLQTNRTQLGVDVLACSACPPSPSRLTMDSSSANFLSPDHELQALSLFWRSHYFSFPIFNEGQLRNEFRALFANSGPGRSRGASPLLDIILALCIQLASSSVLASNDGDYHDPYPSLAGFQYYRRCQEALNYMIETPDLVTVRCYIFSIVYLYEAGLLNRAQVTASKAVLTATMLGLSQEPSTTESEPEKELSRRTWWALYTLDGKLSMETGRPSIIPASSSTCQLPTDSTEFAEWFAPHYQHDPACPPWLGFQTQTLRLVQVVRTIRSTFEARFNEVVGDAGFDAFISDGTVREECARCLSEEMKDVDAWVEQVPKGYQVARKEGHAFSRGRFTLDLAPNPNILIHCQRQRLLLELQYHHLCMSLYQFFICFSASSDISTPLADSNASAALYHAVALTSMMHQALTTSEALGDTYHIYRFQKHALFIMLAYAYTFPLSHAKNTTQKSIELAIAVIDMYRPAISEAGSIATMARALVHDLSTVTKSFHAGSSWTTPPLLPNTGSNSDTSSPGLAPGTLATGGPAVLAQFDANMAAMDPMTLYSDTSFLPSPSHEMMVAKEDLMAPASIPSVKGLSDFSSADMTALHMLQGEGFNWDAMDMFWVSMGSSDDMGAGTWSSLGDATRDSAT
ncbi:Patulin cluster transcription factor patL [Paramyrothecium foliicola]|nr:Patulin cluster transcription factor patL [Paramyrothecium foliicola]